MLHVDAIQGCRPCGSLDISLTAVQSTRHCGFPCTLRRLRQPSCPRLVHRRLLACARCRCNWLSCRVLTQQQVETVYDTASHCTVPPSEMADALACRQWPRLHPVRRRCPRCLLLPSRCQRDASIAIMCHDQNLHAPFAGSEAGCMCGCSHSPPLQSLQDAALRHARCCMSALNPA